MTHVDHIVYHGGCPDGTVGAWVLSKYYPRAKLAGWRHDKPLSSLNGKVIFVDICPKAEVVVGLLADPNISWVVILDHHKSAQRDVEGLQTNSNITGKDKLHVVFDMDRSGCRIAWDFLYPYTMPPWWLLVVEAGDLWRHDSIPNCRELLSALHFYEYLTTLDGVERLVSEGRTEFDMLGVGMVISQYREGLAKTYAKRYTMMRLINPNDASQSYRVAVGTSSPELRSEVGNLLSKLDCDFSTIVTFDPESDQIWLSFRGSAASTIDLSVVSKELFNGGGHPKASGASISRDLWPKYFQVDRGTDKGDKVRGTD